VLRKIGPPHFACGFMVTTSVTHQNAQFLGNPEAHMRLYIVWCLHLHSKQNRCVCACAVQWSVHSASRENSLFVWDAKNRQLTVTN